MPEHMEYRIPFPVLPSTVAMATNVPEVVMVDDDDKVEKVMAEGNNISATSDDLQAFLDDQGFD
jgi:hypothetical protein